jgi:hypothetical protein
MRALQTSPAAARVDAPGVAVAPTRALGGRCQETRVGYGMRVVDAASMLSVASRQISAIERGCFHEVEPDVARRYVRLLGLESWVRQWSRAHPRLARQAGLGGRVRPPARPARQFD